MIKCQRFLSLFETISRLDTVKKSVEETACLEPRWAHKGLYMNSSTSSTASTFGFVAASVMLLISNGF